MKAAALTIVLLASTPAFAQRLPANVSPTHYEIAVATDLAAATFTGTETIDVTLAGAAREVVLNAAEITFTDVTITAGGESQKATITLDAAKEQATFSVPEPVPAGPAKIAIDYTGILNDDLRGLYLSKANNRRYAVTQMEATDARRMFPSFDEPAYKATFDLSATIDAGDHAISNGAVVLDQPGPGAGKHTVRFATTPKMSSYLVALAVGDFVCNEGAADGIPIRVCSTPDKKDLTKFALEATQQIVKYYDQYYAVKYPFKKLDIVAVPDFSAGAMENTAAIFYRETLLLAEPNAAVGTRRDVASVLAHEIAHQWFGDLVTMAWWDDIWLNEGFATWMQTKPLKAWHPDWQAELTETSDNQSALRLDALASTRPIRASASTPAEIAELFDPIAYEKGAAVLRMIESWVGEEEFRTAVNAYVGRFKYGNAKAEDFWTTVATSTKKPVDKVMQSFVDQPGAPLIGVEVACASGKETVTLTQRRYQMAAASSSPARPQVWQIPVCVRTADDKTSCELLDAPRKTIILAACQAWTMPNAGGRGYYRSSVDDAALAALTKNIGSLTGPERLSLLSDQWALVRAGTRPVGAFLGFASGFSGERNPQVLSSLYGMLSAVDEEFTTDATRAQFHAWVTKLSSSASRALGWSAARTATPTAADDDATAARATLLAQLGGLARDPAAIAEARKLVDQEIAKPGSVEPTMLNVAVGVAASGGDQALYEKYLARATAAVDPEERYRFLYGLTGFSDPALVRRTIDYVLGPDVRSQDTKLFLAALLGNEASRAITWDVMRQRWSDVQKKTGEFVGNTVIVNALSSFCDTGRAAEVKAFFAEHPVPDAERTLAQTLERISTCAANAQVQRGHLEEWLSDAK